MGEWEYTGKLRPCCHIPNSWGPHPTAAAFIYRDRYRTWGDIYLEVRDAECFSPWWVGEAIRHPGNESRACCIPGHLYTLEVNRTSVALHVSFAPFLLFWFRST